jgi:uncharacterized membrane protein YtjA (UPF0391 family)
LPNFFAGFGSKFALYEAGGRNGAATYRRNLEGGTMLYWALAFLLIALVAGVLGFGGIAAASAGIAKILFFIFLVLFLIGLIMHFGRRGSAV